MPVLHIVHNETLHTSGHLLEFTKETLLSSLGYCGDSGTGTRILFGYNVTVLCPHVSYNFTNLGVIISVSKTHHS